MKEDEKMNGNRKKNCNDYNQSVTMVLPINWDLCALERKIEIALKI